MTQQTQYYTDTSAHYLTAARAYLADGDLLQASEKGWGAAAEMVKAVAEARGWPHTTHRDLWRAVHRVAEEAGDPQMLDHFTHAGSLHMNFYEGWLSQLAVERGLANVEELLRKLGALSG